MVFSKERLTSSNIRSLWIFTLSYFGLWGWSSLSSKLPLVLTLPSLARALEQVESASISCMIHMKWNSNLWGFTCSNSAAKVGLSKDSKQLDYVIVYQSLQVRSESRIPPQRFTCTCFLVEKERECEIVYSKEKTKRSWLNLVWWKQDVLTDTKSGLMNYFATMSLTTWRCILKYFVFVWYCRFFDILIVLWLSQYSRMVESFINPNL